MVEVLLVEDSATVSRALARELEDHKLTTTTNAIDAARLIESGGRFDVILCDINLDGMSGMELWARLNASCPEQAERMLFMTGGVYTSQEADFLAGAPNGWLLKPFRSEHPHEAIERVFRARGPSAR
jgi:CheY-like chemotaxis protein